MRFGKVRLQPWLVPVLLVFIAWPARGAGGGEGETASPRSRGDSGSHASPASGPFVAVTISDPAVCGTSRGGPFQHIYVAITDVQAFTSPTSLQGGVDLTPTLSEHPIQIDLLGAPRGCVLATLASSTWVPAGTYKQLALSLAGRDQASKIPGGTKCRGGSASCAVLADGSVVDLDASSVGSQQYSIPPERIAGGQITLVHGLHTLNIDVDACASMLLIGGVGYGIDPTMFAALLPPSGAIIGRVLDLNTKQPIAGDTIIALEQQDGDGVDREIMQTGPGREGSFKLCPVPAGTYDVVAAAVSEAGTAYAATIITGVQPGYSLGDVLLQPAGAPANITGQVTASFDGFPGYSHVLVSALQGIASRLVHKYSYI